MSKTNLAGSIEFTINSVLTRLSKLDGKNKESLESEFREWIGALETEEKRYDVLYINKIN